MKRGVPKPDHLTLGETCPTWGPCPLIERLEECRRMLAVHGILPDSENDRARRRILNAAERIREGRDG